MEPQQRRSLINLNSLKKLQRVQQRFTDPNYLTKNSLFSNLYSSENLDFQSPDKQFVRLFFNRQSISNQRYEFTYFHQRDKKIFLYQFIFNYLKHVNKNELVIIENLEKINKFDLVNFLQSMGDQKIVQQYQKRVHFQYCENRDILRFNLQYLPLFFKDRQFLKCIILSDINTFDFKDKGSTEKVYKKLPPNILTVSFLKDTNEYKFVESAPYDRNSDNHSQVYHLNEKVINTLNKNINSAYIVPIEYIGISNSNYDESFRSVLLRKNGDDLYEFIIRGLPYKINAYRKI